jgi:DNA polymerase I-like protein with 3'-5' exonuclease and polymerase domains
MLITGKTFENVTDDDRQLGKRARHAANYGIGKHQLMLTLAKNGMFISEWKAGKTLEKIHMASPNIRNVFHTEIQQALSDNNCVLVSPHGRRRQFLNRWGEELFKEAYSFIPQATVSDHLKLAMLRIRKRLPVPHFYFVLESHDSFTALCKLWLAPYAVKAIHEELNVPISFRQCSLSRDVDLVIPGEVKVGTILSKLVEYKREMD